MQRRLPKLSHFVGAPKFAGPAIFLNSMPKAGTNILEGLLVAIGYKRNWARCLNESNLAASRISPKPGRFYVGHLFDDDRIQGVGFTTIFLVRSLDNCLKSYVNYMFIDTRHPVSAFLRENPTLETVAKLYFTSDNPNGRPLVDEYLRFSQVDIRRYSVRVDYERLVQAEPDTLDRLGRAIGADPRVLEQHLERVLAGEGYTKNAGRVDLFRNFGNRDLAELADRLRAAAPPAPR